MHTGLSPPIWNNSMKNALAASLADPNTCEDCVEPIYPSTEITSQCTDRCVVIACTDPDHSAISCHGSGAVHCDLVCDGTANCTDCNGFDEFLQCCTDYHSYSSDPRNADSLANTTFSWDSSFDEFLCACGAQPTELPTQVKPHPHPASVYCVPSTHVHSPNLPETRVPTSHPLFPIPSTRHDSSSISPRPTPLVDQTLTLSCMWGDCQARFSSLSDLVGHVNLEHLRLPSNTTSSPPNRIPDVDPSHLSCLWRDCNIYPSSESIPTSSSGDTADGMRSILANHLLHDHLGSYHFHGSLDSPRQELESVQTQPALVLDTSECSPTPPPPWDSLSGTHQCCWQSCGQKFCTFEDLTSHITNIHVGGGKAQYECLWQGCNRNGDNGFSSKQKICRHLQSHTGHRPYQCNICQQYFSEAATLQQHMRRHTQEKPYTCDFPGCGKSFAITGALTIHKRTHNGHKPFKCKYCDKAFAESSNLSKHLRTHTGARPYACTEPGCNKSFARPDQLTRHVGVHRKKSSASAMDFAEPVTEVS